MGLVCGEDREEGWGGVCEGNKDLSFAILFVPFVKISLLCMFPALLILFLYFLPTQCRYETHDAPLDIDPLIHRKADSSSIAQHQHIAF